MVCVTHVEVRPAIFHVTAVFELAQTDNHQIARMMLCGAPLSEDVLSVTGWQTN